MNSASDEAQSESTRLRPIPLVAGLAGAVLLGLANPLSLAPAAAPVLAVGFLMVVWWVTEALPMPVVSLIPLVAFPLLGINKFEATAASYANPVVFLFMGGFLIGLAIEKWNLHRRIALGIVRLTGTGGNTIVLGFILATGLISMWLSNTATTMMMYPIALSVIRLLEANRTEGENHAHFALAVMLAIAYASNIGGIATIIGTPPNVAYVGYLEKRFPGSAPTFARWMMLCLPMSLILLGCLHLVLVKWLFPNRIRPRERTKALIHDEIAALGPMTAPEKRVLAVFAGTALLWITRGLINSAQPWFKLDDNMIALFAAMVLFLCPAGRRDGPKDQALLQWRDTDRMAWGILLLFGGGIALATAFENAGLVDQLGRWLATFSHDPLTMILAVTVVTIFTSEIMSNVAQVIIFAPVVTSLAVALKLDPLVLGMPMTLAASCAGMLPMGTPPNAIVFASGRIRLGQMAKAGLVMNLVAIIVITVFCRWVLPLVR